MRRILLLCSLLMLVGMSEAFALTAKLTWTNGTGQTGNRIERQVGTGAFSPLATVGGTVTSYDDPTVVESTAYCFRVVSFNTAGDATNIPTVCGSHMPVPTGATGLGLTWH